METYRVPEGWVGCSLADIVTINPKNQASAEIMAGFVPMALAPTDYHGTLRYEKKQWGEIKKSYTNFANGDVIFAKVTPCFENGKAAIVRDMPNNIGAGSSEFYVLRPFNTDVSPNLIFAVIEDRTFMQQGAHNMTGAVGLRRVPRAFVEAFPVALPPVAEQKVIADKLDTLLAQVENTKARLEHIPKILKRFRQSVLSAAVSGRLTEEWRNHHSFDAKEQFANIQRNFLSKPPNEGMAKFQHLPPAWEWALVKQVGAVQLGRQRAPKFHHGPNMRPYLRVANVMEGYIDTRDVMEMNFDEQDYKRYQLFQGDILLNEGQSHELVGRPAIFNEEVDEVCFTNTLVRFRPTQGVSNKFAYLVFLSYLKTGRFQEIATRTVNISHLGAGRFADMEFPFPSIEEQTEIVRRVDQLFAYADTIEKQVNNALARVNNLTQSILAKAFRGELTEQWRKDDPELISGDNSAEALLSRIKAEQAAITPAKKTRKKVSS